VYVLDRNFYSVDLVEAIHRRGAGAHLVMRMKAGIRLPVVTHDWATETTCPGSAPPTSGR
jgi:hypothetical protein